MLLRTAAPASFSPARSHARSLLHQALCLRPFLAPALMGLLLTTHQPLSGGLGAPDVHGHDRLHGRLGRACPTVHEWVDNDRHTSHPKHPRPNKLRIPQDRGSSSSRQEVVSLTYMPVVHGLSHPPEMLCVSGDVALICSTVTEPMEKPSTPETSMPSQKTGLNSCQEGDGQQWGAGARVVISQR